MNAKNTTQETRREDRTRTQDAKRLARLRKIQRKQADATRCPACGHSLAICICQRMDD